MHIGRERLNSNNGKVPGETVGSDIWPMYITYLHEDVCP